MKKATIDDFARMCNKMDDCCDCPMGHKTANDCTSCDLLLRDEPDKANEIILKWCEEHPIKTRQDKFLKMFPNASVDHNGILDVCPKAINIDNKCTAIVKTCGECCEEYWLAEVDENE